MEQRKDTGSRNTASDRKLGRDSALDETHIINGWSINGINHLSNFGHFIYCNMGHRRTQ